MQLPCWHSDYYMDQDSRHADQPNEFNHLLVPAVQSAFIFMWSTLSLKDKFLLAGGCIKSKRAVNLFFDEI